MPLSTTALKRAQAIASATPVNRGGYDRALIQAYLSDEEVVSALAATGVGIGVVSVAEALRAIGGR